jgi:hypothetical protein
VNGSATDRADSGNNLVHFIRDLLEGVRHKAHRRSGYCLANRFRIGRVIFGRLHVWHDELRCHQLDQLFLALPVARPVMRATTCFHTDETGGQIGEEHGHLIALDLLLEHCPAH